MRKLLIMAIVFFVSIALESCESLQTNSTNAITSQNSSLSDSNSRVGSSDSSSNSNVLTSGASTTQEPDEYTYEFKSGENRYYLDWAYTDSDKIIGINKNSGILLWGASGMEMQDRLFEADLKIELQKYGYNNILLASSFSDYKNDFDNVSANAVLNGCEYVIAYGLKETWTYNKGGGLAGSNSTLYIIQVASVTPKDELTTVSYDFVVSANNSFQSYNASLVTFNAFMAKQIMKEIKVHLSDEPGSEDSQWFFDAGQKGLIWESFKNGN